MQTTQLLNIRLQLRVRKIPDTISLPLAPQAFLRQTGGLEGS